MQRVVRDGAELAVGFHHAGHVGVLDGDDDIIEIELFQQAHMIQRTLHHGFRRGCAIFGKDVLFQAAAVHADADGDVLALAGVHHCLHAAVVANIAGVDANFVHTHVCTGQRGLIVKVDVRHDGDAHGVLDRFDAPGVRRAGTGHAQNLAARCLAALCLCHIALDVLHRNIQHGLHRNGVAAANGHVSNFDFPLFLPHKAPLSVTWLRSRAG